jgi:integrase
VEVKVQEPYTEKELADTIRMAKELGYAATTAPTTTTPAATVTLKECIAGYMQERSVRAKSRLETAAILERYGKWCETEGADAFDMITATRYKAEVIMTQGWSVRTVNKHIGRLRSLFAWAKRHRHAHDVPFDGLNIPKPKRKASDERDAYTHAHVEELLALVNLSNDRWWFPLLSIYTGHGPNELCSLYLSDIREHNGIAYLDINEDTPDKHVKTANSARLIPLHSELLRRGFLQHVEKLRSEGKTRLFEMWPHHPLNGYSNAGCKWLIGSEARLSLLSMA